jgi:hypothetical protein
MIMNRSYFSTVNMTDPSRNEEAGDVCIANISPAERKKRMQFGIYQLIASLIVLAVLVILDVNPLWRLPLFFMFTAAASGYFQAKEKT